SRNACQSVNFFLLDGPVPTCGRAPAQRSLSRGPRGREVPMTRQLTLALFFALATMVEPVAAGRGDPFGGDDSGCVPPGFNNGECEDGVAKAMAKYAQAVIKCHKRTAHLGFGGDADEFCESLPSGKGAKEKYDAAIAKLSGCSSHCAVIGAPTLRATFEAL